MSVCHDRSVRTALTVTSLLLATGLLGGCGTSEPESAKDLAKAAGCSDIEEATVPADRPQYEESVTCTVNDVEVQVYWAPDRSSAECLSDSDRCKAAVDKFRRH